MGFLCLFGSYCGAQSTDSLASPAKDIPSKYYAKVDKKINSVDEQLTKKSIKYLAKFQRQEAKLQRKMQKLHPELVIGSAGEEYGALSRKIKSKAAPLAKIAGGEYNSYLDSLGTSLSFLKQFDGISGKVKQPLSSLNQLQSKLQETEKIKAFIAERRNQLKGMLSKYTKLPAGLKGQYARLSRTAYYYSAQIAEYKKTLKDPEKIEQQMLEILNKLPAFQTFMQKNSRLASLFNLPGNAASGDPALALAGLQTRASVQGMIQQRIAAGGPNAMAQVQQNIQNAQAQLSELKDKLLKNPIAGGGDGSDMPDFKPNTQKTKPFLKRLEYGFNVQFSKSSIVLPSGSDLALTVGYKMNDKSVIGIGVSYKLGLGSIQHINLTSQAVGLRSYLDWKGPFASSKTKLLSSLWVSGGFEMNYNTAFKNIEQLKKYDAWQRSALIGISKKYHVSKKLKGNMQILYDVLYRSHAPVGQPVVLRMGYNF